jgi:hypothetical protein
MPAWKNRFPPIKTRSTPLETKCSYGMALDASKKHFFASPEDAVCREDLLEARQSTQMSICIV